MAECIEREAAINAFLAEPPEAHYPWWYVEILKKLSAADIDRPTVSQFKRMAAQMDYAPVVHGRWIIGVDNDDFDVKCSKCEWNDIFEVAGISTVERIAKAMHYCPNCGARMDGNDGG